MGNLKIEIDLNVLNHLGIGLYSNTPAVLTEIVANSWDADSENVYINIDSKGNEIIIEDDGHGMDESDVQMKFLTVGYARRTKGEAITPKGRQCMGRKGIGKLAMFSLADEIEVVTKKSSSDVCAFRIDVAELKEKIQDGSDYQPEIIYGVDCNFPSSSGTKIYLRKLNKQINRTESFLRKRLSRRFSVIGESQKFSIKINNSPVTVKDRGFYDDIQLLWTFGEGADEIKNICKNYKKHHHFDGYLNDGSSVKEVSGFIGGVFKPEMLKKNDDNNNTITIMANGRVFVEDVQKSIDDSKIFNSYLVGELRADFFDNNTDEDMAVSSRQGVNENDPRYRMFLSYVKARLADIGKQWTEWRQELGSAETEKEFPKITEWYETLTDRHRKKAKQLVGRVATTRFQGSEDEQKQQRRELLRHQILAFEKLSITENLDLIDAIDFDQNVSEFRDVILSIEDIEASMHYSIFEQRLAVIRKLREHSDNQVKERVVQDHIYNNLWLIDPTFYHVEGSTEMEKTITEHLKQACPDNDEGARYDIGYRSIAGRYIVVELKKPGLSVNFEKLRDQGRKYYIALNQYFNDNPGSCPIHGQTPHIEVVFLVGKSPVSNVKHVRELQEHELSGINAQIKTYTDLINQAERTYEDQIAVLAKVDKIRRITESI